MFARSMLLLAFAVAAVCRAENVPAPVEIRQGTLPIILTVPHGGSLKPPGMLARRYGVTTQDSNTIELSLLLMEEMEKLYGGRPHAVICRLHRSKVDCNRPVEEAAQGDAQAIAAWNLFHETAEGMEKKVTRDFGAGLVLDIHGHRHQEARVELGYLISGALLNEASDEDLNSDAKYLRMTSIRELVKRTRTPLAELIRGPQSLGAMLETQGVKAIPSPALRSPGAALYYSGAYNVTAHGSRDGGPISAIQVECPWLGVRDTPANQRKFAKALAVSLGQYFQAHFQMSLGRDVKAKR